MQRTAAKVLNKSPLKVHRREAKSPDTAMQYNDCKGELNAAGDDSTEPYIDHIAELELVEQLATQ